MPYATGETPEVGDYVKNQWEQLGTVTRVHATQGALERINPAGLTFPWRLLRSLRYSPGRVVELCYWVKRTQSAPRWSANSVE
jgi:hypothetical protein